MTDATEPQAASDAPADGVRVSPYWPPQGAVAVAERATRVPSGGQAFVPPNPASPAAPSPFGAGAPGNFAPYPGVASPAQPGGPGPGLAVTSLIAGILALLFAISSPLRIETLALFLTTVVCGALALRKNRRGRGMAISALVCAGVVALVSVGPAIDRINEATRTPAPTPSSSYASAADLAPFEVAESAFGFDESADVWWYAVVLHDPNEHAQMWSEQVGIEALSADGQVIAEAVGYPLFVHDRFAVVGRWSADSLNAAIEELRVTLPEPATPFRESEEVLYFVSATELDASGSGSPAARGEVLRRSEASSDFVEVAVLARDSNRTIVGAGLSYPPAFTDQDTTTFTAVMFGTLSDDVTFDVLVQ